MTRQMWQHVQMRANCGPKKLALTDGQLTLDYRTLVIEVDRLAKQLKTACPGTRPIILCLDNSPAWVLLDLALMLLKRCAVPVPGFFTNAQMEFVAAQSGAEYVIKEVVTGDNDLNVAGKKLQVQHILTAPVALLPGTAKITFTSGSTGHPKGVCLSGALMESVAFSLVDAIGEENAGIHSAILPLSVLLENVAGLYTTLIAGGSYHVASSASNGLANPFKPDFAALAIALARQSATSTILVPEMLLGLMHALSSAKQKLPELKFVAVGGANVSSSLLERAAALGLPVYQGYGLSEAASVVAVNTPKSNKPGSVGRILPHVKLSFGDDGEILLQTPDLLGYVGHPLGQADFATADVGHVDRDGFLFIDGRKSNVIISSFGRNVSPEWIESELIANSQIGQAMVYGEAAPFLSALIVPASPEVSDDVIVKVVAQTNLRLPAYAHVSRWFKVNRFTAANGMLTANGRLQRPAINKEYSNLMNANPANTNKPDRLFEKLISETVEERNYLLATKQIQDGLAGHISLQTYLHYLAEAYYHVRHTVPLLSLARDNLAKADQWLVPSFDEYIAEESGHEEWILDDIRNAGGDAEKVRHGTPRMATELMVAYAYDYVTRVNPVGFFGMVLVLEGTSTALATAGAGALMKSLKLPESCFHYLTSHGSLDLEHMRFFEGLMDRIENPKHQAAIVHMAKRMYILFANVFRAIPHEGARQNAA